MSQDSRSVSREAIRGPNLLAIPSGYEPHSEVSDLNVATCSTKGLAGSSSLSELGLGSGYLGICACRLHSRT